MRITRSRLYLGAFREVGAKILKLIFFENTLGKRK